MIEPSVIQIAQMISDKIKAIQEEAKQITSKQVIYNVP